LRHFGLFWGKVCAGGANCRPRRRDESTTCQSAAQRSGKTVFADYAAFWSEFGLSADTEELSVVDWEVFSGPQFILERAIETLIGINSKRLEIEIKQSVVAVPDGRVVF
jgi:hypothetical protein